MELKHRMHVHAEGEVRKAQDKNDILGDSKDDGASAKAGAKAPAKVKAGTRVDPKAVVNGRPPSKAVSKAGVPKAKVAARSKAAVEEDKIVMTEDIKITTTITETTTGMAPTPVLQETTEVDIVEECISVQQNGDVAAPIASSPAAPAATNAQTQAVMASKDTLIAVLREQLKDKEDKEDLYKKKIAALQQEVSMYQQSASETPVREVEVPVVKEIVEVVEPQGHVISRRPWTFNAVERGSNSHPGTIPVYETPLIQTPLVYETPLIQQPLQPRAVERQRSPLMSPAGRVPIRFQSGSSPPQDLFPVATAEFSPHIYSTQPTLAQAVGYR